MSQAILRDEFKAHSAVLYMALELGDRNWRLVLSDGQRLSRRSVSAGDRAAVVEAVAAAKRRFKMTGSVRVVSCYEAGRDGFWLHRWLLSEGIENIVVDSASILVDRRRRRAKTDRLDGDRLVALLIRHVGGERAVWRRVRVPSRAAEDERRSSRELGRLTKERTAHRSRLQSLLVVHGVRLEGGFKDFVGQLSRLRLWDGTALDERLRSELEREWQRLELVEAQMAALAAARRARLRQAADATAEMAGHLMRLKGIGDAGGWTLVEEFFGWRQFDNGRQVGSLSGLVGVPFASGQDARDQGISKAGNKRVRALMVQLAWGWVRFQPDSALTRWYQARFGDGGKRLKRIGIVALARRLLVALWRYVAFGEVPKGAVVAD